MYIFIYVRWPPGIVSTFASTVAGKRAHTSVYAYIYVNTHTAYFLHQPRLDHTC